MNQTSKVIIIQQYVKYINQLSFLRQNLTSVIWVYWQFINLFPTSRELVIDICNTSWNFTIINSSIQRNENTLYNFLFSTPDALYTALQKIFHSFFYCFCEIMTLFKNYFCIFNGIMVYER